MKFWLPILVVHTLFLCPFSALADKIIRIKTPRATVTCERAGTPGGPVWVLVHGFGQDSEAWKESAQVLVRSGFDVWKINLPGHGKNQLYSRMDNESPGAYGIESIFSELPSVFDQIHLFTRQKLTVVGHSLGGVLIQLYLAGGQTSGNGQIILNRNRAKEIAQKTIDKFISIGAPYRLDIPMQQHVLDLLLSFQPILNMRSALPSFMRGMMDLAISMNPFNRTAVAVLAQGLMNPDNYTDVELSDLLSNGLSPSHPDLVRSLKRFHERGNFFLGKTSAGQAENSMYVPTVLISGTEDWVAPPGLAQETAGRFGSNAPVTAVVIPGKSHVDMINGLSAQEVFFEAISAANSQKNQVRISEIKSCKEVVGE